MFVDLLIFFVEFEKFTFLKNIFQFRPSMNLPLGQVHYVPWGQVHYVPWGQVHYVPWGQVHYVPWGQVDYVPPLSV